MRAIRSILMFFAVVLLLAAPFWAGAITTYTDRFGLGMPEQGDVGWDDEIRTNHKTWEVVLGAILDNHSVKSGATPADAGGLVLSWDAGEVRFAGVEYSLDSGATTLPNNTGIVWVTAVPITGTSGATIAVAAGEYEYPSGETSYYTPVALAKTAAGDIEFMKDVRYLPPYAVSDQVLGTGDDVQFGSVYSSGQVDAETVNIRGTSGITLEGAASVSPTVAGQVSYDTDDHFIAVGDGSNTRAVLTGHTVYCIIASPDLLAAETQPVWRNVSGTTFIIQNALFRTSHSGTTLDMGSGASPYSSQYADATALWSGVAGWDLSGNSVYAIDFKSGTSIIPPDYPVLLRYGGGSSADWLEITLGGYLEGNK